MEKGKKEKADSISVNETFSPFHFFTFKRSERAIYLPDDSLCTKPSVRLSAGKARGRACRSGRRQYQIAPERSRPPPLFSNGISDIAAVASYSADRKFPVLFPCKEKHPYTARTTFPNPALLFFLLFWRRIL
jgi:hypothetical protein